MNRLIRETRAIHRANHRGLRELDLILSTWAKDNVPKLTDKQLSEFEVLLDEEVPDLFRWISGQEPIPSLYRQSTVMQTVIDYVRTGNVLKYKQ